MQQLSLHLAENLAELDARFGASADYYAKEIMIYHCRGCIVLFDGMASLDSLWELLLDAASRQALQQPCPCTGQEVYEHILHGSASPAESTPVEDLPDLVKRLTAGIHLRRGPGRGRDGAVPVRTGGLPLLAARRRIPHRPAAIGGNIGGFFHRPVIQWPCRTRGAKGE